MDDKPMVIHKKKKAELHVVKKDKPMGEKKRLKIMSSDNGRNRKDKISGASLPKKKGTININLKSAGAVGASSTLNHVEGGEEVKDAAKVAYGIYQPVGSTAKRSAGIYKKGMMQFRKQRIKQVENGKKIAKRKIKKSMEKKATSTTKEVSKTVTKQTAKETARQTAKAAAQTTEQAESTAAGSIAGSYGMGIGYAAGREVSKKIDKVGEKKELRSRKINFFLDKMRAKENQQDSVAKLAKDLIAGKLMEKIKGAVALTAAGLVLMLLLVSVIIVPVTAVIAVIYNSPFAIFFPPLEAGDTVITVTGTYVSEFNREVNDLINSHSGCDMGMKVYVDYEGSASVPSNNYDIMAVYMVKYGVGDTATIMNSKSKKRLKEIVDDMCSYTTSTGTENITDSNGNSSSKSCYYVNITLKTYSDMISEYGFDSDEVSLLNDMMSPESMALLNSNAGNGLATMTEDEIDDIVSGISDGNTNGSFYVLISKFTEDTFFMQNVKTKKYLVAIGVNKYKIYPEGEVPDKDNTKTGIMWEHGRYLGNELTDIDMYSLKREYMARGEVESFDDFYSDIREHSGNKGKTYEITVTETLSRKEVVKADSLQEAKDKVMERYYGQKIVLMLYHFS